MEIIGIAKELFGIGSAIWMLVIIIVGTLCWRGRGLYGKLAKIDNLPCKEHERALAERQKQAHDIDVKLAKIDTELVNLSRMITMFAMPPTNPNLAPLTQSQSPISLTNEGKEVDVKLGIADAVNSNWEYIKTLGDNKVTPYDIQESFIKAFLLYPEVYFSTTFMNRVKFDAFMSGRSLVEYMRIAAIIARDRFFKENNLDLASIDDDISNRIVTKPNSNATD